MALPGSLPDLSTIKIIKGSRFILKFPKSHKRRALCNIRFVAITNKTSWYDINGAQVEVIADYEFAAKADPILEVKFVNEEWNKPWGGESLKFFYRNLQQISSPPTKPVCTCIATSCTCGAFIQEMKLKGLIYNKWTKYWEKPR